MNDTTEPVLVRWSTACGRDQTVAAGAVDWLNDRHAHAHNKGIDGLSAGGCEVTVGGVADQLCPSCARGLRTYCTCVPAAPAGPGTTGGDPT